MSYLLSVIVPTKNRYIYLKDCLKTMVAIQSEELEIVVHDNTQDNQEITEYISELNWPHIKYYHDDRPLSQTENSDLALSYTTGKYICYIGDDDTILGCMIDIVKWLDENEIEACSFPAARFYWPDVKFKFFKYPPFSYKKFNANLRRVDPIQELNRTLIQGGTSLNTMPKVYHGIVAKTVLDKVFSKTGSYFPGPSPDMANATALALVTRKQVWLDLPLMISGYSYKSAGGMGARGAHKARIKDVAQLPKDTEEKWEKNIPKVWLASTIWAESCSKSLKAMGEEQKLKSMNWSQLYAAMIIHDKEYHIDVKPFLNKTDIRIRTYYMCLLLLFSKAKSFILNLFLTKFKISSKKVFLNVNSLEEASEIINKDLNIDEMISVINREF